MLKIIPVSLESKILCHPDEEAGHHVRESGAVISARKEQEDAECLHEDNVGGVKEVGFRKEMLQAVTILRGEVGLGRTEIRQDLKSK